MCFDEGLCCLLGLCCLGWSCLGGWRFEGSRTLWLFNYENEIYIFIYIEFNGKMNM